MHRIQADIDEFVAFEKRAQPLADSIYTRFGFTVDRASASREFDCLITKDGNTWKVEEKFRQKDYGDFLIEIWQAEEVSQRGWFYHCKADFLFYAIIEGNRIQRAYFIAWDPFRKWFEINRNSIPTQERRSSRGIGHSLNLAVSWKDIPANLYSVIR